MIRISRRPPGRRHRATAHGAFVTAAFAWLIAGLASGPAHAQRASNKSVKELKPERVIIIDMRADSLIAQPGQADRRASSREKLSTELAQISGIAQVGDPELARALAGHAPESSRGRDARTALAKAKAAYDSSDCTGAVAAANRAIDALAALQAGGEAVIDDLVQAYVYLLLCAHNAGDSDRAMRAAKQLDRLGVTRAPAGVGDLVWNLYPSLDATTNTHIVELTLDTDPEGGEVWIDHQRVAVAPVITLASEGEHVIAGAREHARGARRVRVDGGAKGEQTETIQLTDGRGTWHDVAATVAGWRRGSPPSSADALGALLKQLDVRFALVLAGSKDRVQIWSLGPGETLAKRIGSGPMTDASDIADKVLARVRRWEQTGPDPDVALLRENPTRRKTADKPTRWWIYASIVGAVVLGAGVVLANDLADDRQRIELTFP